MYDAEFENEALVNGDLRCESPQSVGWVVGKNEKSAIFPAATAFLQRKTARSFVNRGFKEL